VILTVVEPKITIDDVPELPYEDIEMLAELATRQRDLDAVGNHIGGLHEVEAFRTFRGLGAADSPLANL
jgi:hypothetical protein